MSFLSRINPFIRKPKATKLTIGMRVRFNGVLYTISGDSSYYDDAVNLLLEPVKAKGFRGPLDD